MLIVAAVLPMPAIADRRAQASDGATDVSVTVLRGSEAQVQGGPRKAGSAENPATPPGRQEQGVIVMRPTAGSFMRETTRLAAEADARLERAAQAEAREANLALTEALQAVQSAANEVRTQQRTKRYLIVVPTGRSASAHPDAVAIRARGT